MNGKYKRNPWVRAAVPVAVLALALTACNGGDDAAGTGKESAGSGKSSAPAKGSTGELEDGGSDDQQLGAGESAKAAFKEDDGAITYSVAAQKVNIGTEEDTKKLVSDPAKAKGFVPAVAYVKYTNEGGGTVASYPDVGDNVEVYADGNRGSILIGASEDAPGCESDSDIENWGKGQSHVICQTYMIPKGSKEVAVHWAADEDSNKPYVWTFKAS
ncbi:hypothetical protein [Streptomyces sp. NPDC059828]|uniref:hypothetical protein n=1 Tax=Streptomyces sp. NPDC059828 TaxID=3346965 RepID=UPI003652DCEF